MSIVTLNTQSLTFAIPYSKGSHVVFDPNSNAKPFNFQFYTDGKGNVLSRAEDAAYLYVDCEKRVIWTNLNGSTLPSYTDVMHHLEIDCPLVSQYIQKATHRHSDTAMSLERLLVSLPVIHVPMKTVFRMEQTFRRSSLAMIETPYPYAGADQRTLYGHRMIGFTENGSIAPIYKRTMHSTERYFQDMSETRYGLIVLHYDYTDQFPTEIVDNSNRAAAKLRGLLDPLSKILLLSFRVRADGAIRTYPRSHISNKWLTKLEIPEEGEFVFNHGLEHVLQPLATPWAENLVFAPMELPLDQYYMRYLRPTTSGSLNVNNTNHTLLFTLNGEGKPVFIHDRKELTQGLTVYQLSSSMYQARTRVNRRVNGGAEHVVKPLRSSQMREDYLGFYSCNSYIASADGRLTTDGINAALSPIAEMSPTMIARMLHELSIYDRDWYNVVTFQNLKA